MKRFRFIAVVTAVICMLSLPTTSLAVESRASDQISVYIMNVIPLTDRLAVDFSTTGTGTMTKLGCQSIYIYKQSGSSWIYQDSFLEDDEGMSKTNTHFHTNTICWDSIAGVNYKVVITIFAENSAGRDTRSRTFYVTGE